MLLVSLTLLVIAALALSAPRAALAGFTPTPTNTETPTPTPASPLPTATPAAPQPTPVPIVLDPLITKRVNLQQAQVGDSVEFTITATNPNDIPVDNVIVNDPLPREVDFLSATTTQGAFTYDLPTHTLVFTLGTMAPKQEIVMVIQARVNDFGQPPDLISNAATLTSNATSATVRSEAVLVQLVPGALPEAGIAPEPPAWPTLLLALLAALLPLAAREMWKRLRVK
jgi:uncharacterized repeat protein (TIGR01451 family)